MICEKSYSGTICNNDVTKIPISYTDKVTYNICMYNTLVSYLFEDLQISETIFQGV